MLITSILLLILSVNTSEIIVIDLDNPSVTNTQIVESSWQAVDHRNILSRSCDILVEIGIIKFLIGYCILVSFIMLISIYYYLANGGKNPGILFLMLTLPVIGFFIVYFFFVFSITRILKFIQRV